MSDTRDAVSPTLTVEHDGWLRAAIRLGGLADDGKRTPGARDYGSIVVCDADGRQLFLLNVFDHAATRGGSGVNEITVDVIPCGGVKLRPERNVLAFHEGLAQELSADPASGVVAVILARERGASS